MDKRKIQEKRYEKKIPLAVFANTLGISIMELWKIETEPDYYGSDDIMEKISNILYPADEACPAKGA